MTVLFWIVPLKTKNPYIGLLSIVGHVCSIFGYGFAFIRSWYNIQLLNKTLGNNTPKTIFLK